ncbi:uncharacterized protein LOC131028834 isoform X2 [Cryptomeria japonica]|uniref:uncharacterized protein LOC131028834 isoform X2 n=1 Tax=Cryptomeria japonica TaxID=3369 RepID=UPI0027DA77B6|nr:uncharacterized protein LOC131028834 isoform X2 [Cryptomeria japonica]
MDTMAMAVNAHPPLTSRHCFPTPTSKVAVYKVKSVYLVNVRCTYKKHFASHVYSTRESFPLRIPFLSNDKCNRLTINSAAAADTGLEKSKPEVLVINDREITVESREDGKIHVRVNVSGEDTERTFDDILTKLAKEVGPVPGFRRQKGGKSGNVPKFVLLKMLGRSTVRNFVIQELISSTLADYTAQENLNVKEELNTKESAEELDAAFEPGKKFSFSAVIELEEEKPENEQEKEFENEQEEEVIEVETAS